MSFFEDFLSYSLGIVFLASSAVLFRRMFSKGVTFTPFASAFAFFLLTVAPAFFFMPAEYMPHGLTDHLFPVIVFMLAYAGLVSGYLVTPGTRIRIGYRSSSRIESYTPKNRTMGMLFLALLIIVLGIRFYGGMPPTVNSLVATMTGDIGELARDVQRSRLELTKGAYFGGEDRAQGLNNTIQQIGWTILFAWAVARFVANRSTSKILVLISVVLGSWLFVAGTGSRAPFLRLMFAGVIAYSLLRPIKISHVFILFASMLAIAVFLSSYSHKALEYTSEEGLAFRLMLDAIIERLTLGNSQNDVLGILLSHEGILRSDFGHYHIRNFVSAIPGANGGLPLAYHLTAILGGGETTFRTGSYISTVYVDFGLLGVALIFMLVGMTLKIFGANTRISVESPWGVALSTIWISNSSVLITGGYHSLIATSVITILLMGMIWFVDECWSAMTKRYHKRNGGRPIPHEASQVSLQQEKKQ